MKLINKIKISLFISFFIILLLNVKVFAVTGIVTEVTVNVRARASTESKRIMYVTQDDKVEVLEKDEQWYKIKYKNKTGYVFEDYIKVDDSKVNVKTEEPKEEETKDVEKALKVSKNTQIKIIPNISSSVIYTAKKDTSVKIIEQVEGWTYLSIDNILGWTRTNRIIEENVDTSSDAQSKETSSTTSSESENSDSTTSKAEGKIAYVKYDTVNLREKASTSSKAIAKLKLNNTVTILEEVNNVWSKVKYEDKIGYVSTELLSNKKQEVKENKTDTTSRDGQTTSREDDKEDTKEETTKNTTNSKEKTESEVAKEDKNEETNSYVSASVKKGQEIIAYAKRYLGYDYVYGGSSPKTGFDCSGFTYYVYKHFGYTLSRSSVEQASNGKKVEKQNLQPGDLVIYKNTSLTSIGHVGIYIGNNQMIHASEPGVGVIITDIDSKAYKYPQRFVMGRRII